MTAALSPEDSDRILLVVAHSDDEIIAAGGYLAAAREAGSAIRVVILTNGDANRLSAAIVGRRLWPTSGSFIREGEVRQQESLAALKTLGIDHTHVVFLGFPDRGLAALTSQHWARSTPYTSPFTGVSYPPYAGVFRPTPYTGEDLTENLTQLITEFRPTMLLTHAVLDRHPDHRATAELVARAIHRWPQGRAASIQRLGFLIHADNFPRPLRYRPEESLDPPPALLHAATWISFPLTPSTVTLKGTAMRAYRTQYQSPYLRLLLDGFIRSNELFIQSAGED